MSKNKLSVAVFILGMGLLKLALVGWCSSTKLQGSTGEDVRASRYRVTKGFMMMMAYMKMTLMMFFVFTFTALWFTLFYSSSSAYIG